MRRIADPVRPGQESVWSYPRPAIAAPSRSHIVIEHAGRKIAETRAAVRTLETSHPPTYYIPPVDIAPDVLRRSSGGTTLCEWKGTAVYWDVVVGEAVLPRAGWSYPHPTSAFALLRDHVAFYAGPFDRCILDGETVTPQPGEFYGGWITSRLAGPFKGEPGTMGW
ncbi:MAG: DUF427 domain-containing protein [Rhizobiaceae bacterium]|nr:DUF427 domain-containing protein [Rhizobiaceae bacterium]